MTEQLWLLQGLILGVSIAAPVGPIGVLCIRRTLSNGMLYGILSGLGTATADALYGCIAAFGVTAASTFLLNYQPSMHLIGGLFLLYLGYTTFHSIPSEVPAASQNRGFISAYLSACVLTLTNPLTIISFAGVFAGLGISNSGGDYQAAGCLVSGVFFGSMAWWLTLSGAVAILRTKIDHRRLKWINRISGLIITWFGIFSLLSLYRTF